MIRVTSDGFDWRGGDRTHSTPGEDDAETMGTKWSDHQTVPVPPGDGAVNEIPNEPDLLWR